MHLDIQLWYLDGKPLPIAKRRQEPGIAAPSKGFFEFDDAWFRMSEVDVPISSRGYWGEQTEFVVRSREKLDEIALVELNDLMITLANFDLLEKTIRQSLSDIKAATYPPSPVLLEMFDEVLFWQWTDIETINLSDDGSSFIEGIRSEIADSVSMLRSTVLMFLCSVLTNGVYCDVPQPVDDVVGPFTQKRWATILDVSERSVRDWSMENSQKLKKHPSSTHGRIWFYRNSPKLPPDIDERIKCQSGNNRK